MSQTELQYQQEQVQYQKDLERHFEMWYAKQPEAFENDASYGAFTEILLNLQAGAYTMPSQAIRRYKSRFEAHSGGAK